uniref:Uncharacterized protein n=1 Tax=Anguilla anguilla TaxID=7936 RepID=A0A0E9Q344_ANGAN
MDLSRKWMCYSKSGFSCFSLTLQNKCNFFSFFFLVFTNYSSESSAVR